MELALVLSILVLLLFGILEWGRVNAEIEIFEGAAREGARRAAVGEPNGDVIASVEQHASPFDPDDPISVSVQDFGTATTCGDGGSTTGKHVTVSWNQSFAVTIPLWNDVTFTRAIRGVFRCER